MLGLLVEFSELVGILLVVPHSKVVLKKLGLVMVLINMVVHM